MSAEKLTYRPALDGVRALAVLLVFVFHASPAVLPGGFVGVDVFFVLSGYLITRLLVEEWEERGRVSLRRFYARRSRRLVPAVVLLVLGVAVAEGVWGSVLTAGNRAREAVATLFYVANWNLVATADDYFSEGDASPLRHAWSLAVEEQFYLLWPVLLVVVLGLAARRGVAPRRAALSLAVVAGLASATAMWVLHEPSKAARVYYGTDTRIFQPLLGAVLGIVLAGRARPAGRRRAWDAAAVGSLALLVVAAFRLAGDERYFEGGALVVTVLAVLLVVALEHSPTGLVTRLLSLRPVVGLGVVSYGFYLWHWPVLLWMPSPEGATTTERLLAAAAQLVVTVALAVASHRLVEDPIRRRAVWPLGRLAPVPTVGVGVAAITVAAASAYLAISPPDLAAGVDVVAARPLTIDAAEAPSGSAVADPAAPTASAPPAEPPELSRAARDQLAVGAARDRSFDPCPDNPRPCVKVDGGPDAPVVALVGDSTAQAYDPALRVLAERHGLTYVQAAVGGCPIGHRLLATGLDGARHKPSNIECWEELPGIYDEVIATWSPRLVLATSSNEDSPHVVDDEVVPAGSTEHLEDLRVELEAVVDRFVGEGATWAFVDILPPGVGVTCLEDAQPSDPACARPRDPGSIEVTTNAVFGDIASQRAEVERIGLSDLVCLPDTCPLVRDGLVMRYDGGHLTGTASRLLAEPLAERLAGVGIDLDDLAAG